MKRLIEADLLHWKKREDRKPLLLSGIRQVGKTWTVQAFGRQHFKEMLVVNFEKEPRYADIFRKTKTPSKIMQEFALLHGKTYEPRDTLLFLDEVQSCNEALNALKYFAEDSEIWHVIAAGSYLGITLSKGESFPVGKVEFLELMPMTFPEFLMAQQQDVLAEWIQALDHIEPLSDPVFDKLKGLFREYYIVGGMPEAVHTWSLNKDYETLGKVQNGILNAYYRDFSKYPPSSTIPRILGVWDSVVSQLSKDNRKFMFSEIDKGARAREYEGAMDWLVAGGYIHKVKSVGKLDIPLAGYAREAHFKIYMPDVGLLRVKAEYPVSAFSEVYDAANVPFKGALAENMVFQQLRHAYPGTLYYWADMRYSTDFLLQVGAGIHPVEVKYGENIKSPSLTRLLEQNPGMLGIRYSMRNLSLDGSILNIPLPLVSATFRLLDSLAS